MALSLSYNLAGVWSGYPAPPSFALLAMTTYGQGFEHGRLAGESIRGWFAKSCEMRQVFAYALNEGRGADAFENMRRESAERYPQYA